MSPQSSSAITTPNTTTAADLSVSPNNSTSPLIPTEQRQQQDGEPVNATAVDETDVNKVAKRRFFGLGKKKKDDIPSPSITAPTETAPLPTMSTSSSSRPLPADLKPHGSTQPISVSPSRAPFQSAGIVASSPSRLLSNSPRLHSPASSEIFERNVQEQIPISALGGELSPAHIPAHVMTEDHIPPALEASAQAITSEELNPDDVEIVTSASHQPAAATVLESSASGDIAHLQSPLTHTKSDETDPAASLHQSGIIPSGVDEDAASNYGQLDPNDVRRLSFISFKDIVQSEHHHLAVAAAAAAASSSVLGGDIASSRDSLYNGSVSSAAGPLPSSITGPADRTTSPLRSPRSPGSPTHLAAAGVTTPPHPGVPTLNPAVHTNVEQSPVRSVGLGSPASVQHGELTIETMRQALRKTASGDLGHARSAVGAALSPVGSAGDESVFKDVSRRGTDL